jgi:adenosylmethionine-8-amino-7-oxononanoate aminotransferase
MPWMHAYTYSAHPTGCAVALANLDIIEREQFPTQAAEKGAYLLERLQRALGDHPHVGHIRGKGLMVGLEFVQDRRTKAEYPAAEKWGSRVHWAAQARGLYSRLRGESVFCLAPPVITPIAILDEIVEIMTQSIDEVLGTS